MGNLNISGINNLVGNKEWKTAVFDTNIQSIIHEEQTITDLGHVTSYPVGTGVLLDESNISAGSDSTLTVDGVDATTKFARGDDIYLTDAMTATGVLCNESSFAANTQTVITVDGATATSHFAVNDLVFNYTTPANGFSGTTKGNVVGKIASLTGTELTLTHTNEIPVNENDELRVIKYVGTIHPSNTFNSTTIPLTANNVLAINDNQELFSPSSASASTGAAGVLFNHIATLYQTDTTLPMSAPVNIAGSANVIKIVSTNTSIGTKFYRPFLASFDDHGITIGDGTSALELNLGTRDLGFSPSHFFFQGMSQEVYDSPSTSSVRFILRAAAGNSQWTGSLGNLTSSSRGTIRPLITLNTANKHILSAGDPIILSTDWEGLSVSEGASHASRFYYRAVDADNLCFFTDVLMSDGTTALTATTDVFDSLNHALSGAGGKSFPNEPIRINPGSFPAMYKIADGTSLLRTQQGMSQQLDPRYTKIMVTCKKDINVLLAETNTSSTAFNTPEILDSAPVYFIPANTPTILRYATGLYCGIRAEIAHSSDIPTATGILVNDGSNWLVGENSVAVDTVNAHVGLQINDPVYESDGSSWYTFVGVVQAMTGVLITTYCNAETQVDNNGELFRGEQVYFNYVG
jgi:hypothetical protein